LQAQVNTKQNFAFVWGTITTAKPRSHIFSEIKIRELGTATLPKPKRCPNTGEFIMMRNVTADSIFELLPAQLLIVGGIMICVLLGTIAFIKWAPKMPEKPKKSQKEHRQQERLVAHYKKIRIPALAGALEHQDERLQDARTRKRSSSNKRSKHRGD
jgi:hypothetical protein